MSIAQQFWDQQAEWSRATFGSDTERGPLGPLKHLEKEAKEAQENAEWVQKNPEKFDGVKQNTVELRTEIADCLFLTFDAARRAGMTLD